jgi:tetratricopeptide (TPR) repeat protein
MEKNRADARQRWDASRAEMATKLAEGCFERGEYGRAQQHVQDLIRSGATYAPAYALGARLAARTGDLEKARELAQSARRIDPTSAQARYVLGTVLQMLGHTEQALEEFSEAARLSPNEAKYVLAEAELMVALDKADLAVASLAEATTLMPGRAEVHAALGDVLVTMGLFGEASFSYRQAMRLNPDLPGLKEHLARALFRAGAYGEAEPLLADLAKSEPAFAARWVTQMLADSLLAQGRVGDARAVYESRRQVAPGAIEPAVGLAKCDILEERFASARARLEAVLAERADHAEAHALMGYVLVATGRPGDALPHLRFALQSPNCEGRATVERLFARAQKSAKPS